MIVYDLVQDLKSIIEWEIRIRGLWWIGPGNNIHFFLSKPMWYLSFIPFACDKYEFMQINVARQKKGFRNFHAQFVDINRWNIGRFYFFSIWHKIENIKWSKKKSLDSFWWLSRNQFEMYLEICQRAKFHVRLTLVITKGVFMMRSINSKTQ